MIVNIPAIMDVLSCCGMVYLAVVWGVLVPLWIYRGAKDLKRIGRG